MLIGNSALPIANGSRTCNRYRMFEPTNAADLSRRIRTRRQASGDRDRGDQVQQCELSPPITGTCPRATPPGRPVCVSAFDVAVVHRKRLDSSIAVTSEECPDLLARWPPIVLHGQDPDRGLIDGKGLQAPKGGPCRIGTQITHHRWRAETAEDCPPS